MRFPPSPPRPRPYAEFRLGFVIARSAMPLGAVEERLDAIERTLGRLIRRWHASGRLSPARDIRIAPPTLDALMGWIGQIEGRHPAGSGVVERLGVYHCGAVADATVPRGWIRVYM